MIKKDYTQIKETLYMGTLENGLKVYLLLKNDFQRTYGLFMTGYGSTDSTFVPVGQGEMIEVPDRIAHFLEHKMFEKEDGDVFQKFGQQGTSANTFTSFTKTSYLSSTADQVTQNLETLLNFVQSPYFMKETVEKEKDIIEQEIQMYLDDPNWRLFFETLGNFYPKHPLHTGIAGTVTSVAEITAEDLYTCCNTFYRPNNMTLFVAGKMDPEALMAFVRENQAMKEFPAAQPVRRHFSEETAADIVKESAIEMAVTRAKVLVDLKGLDEVPTAGRSLMKYQITMNLLLQLLFGNTSQNYLALYDEGLLDDSSNCDFNLDHSFHFADIGSDSEQSEVLAERIGAILLSATTSLGLTEENLSLLKKKMIGKCFRSLNSLEYTADRFLQSLFGETALPGRIEIIENTQLADVRQIAGTFTHGEGLSRFCMYPKGETE